MEKKSLQWIGLVLVAVASLVLVGCDECEFEAIATGALPDGTVGAEYSKRITTQQNCDVSYSEVTLISGNIPPGISLDEDGYIEGTPTTEGLYTFTLRVEICFSGSTPDEVDDCHQKSKGFSIQINPEPAP